ncbi:hypothetical protein R6Q57_014654 [Mikania cordata]
MRLNYYPPCQKPDQTFGTGPHSDPTSLTIFHQDNLGGLEVFVDEKWHSIAPCSEVFVINIGDTFMVTKKNYQTRYFILKIIKNHEIDLYDDNQSRIPFHRHYRTDYIEVVYIEQL